MSLNESCHFNYQIVMGNIKDLHVSILIATILLSLLIIPTAVLNLLVLAAVWRKALLKTPSNVFLCNLALSDLAVALIGEPAMVAVKFIAMSINNVQISCYISSAITTISVALCFVSFLTIVLSTVDRYLALKFHLTYASRVTLFRVTWTCVLVWVISLFASLAGVFHNTTFKYIITVGGSVCVATMAFCYTKIFLILRYHHAKIQIQRQVPGRQISLPDLTHFRKSVVNLFCIFVWFIVSYASFVCAIAIVSSRGISTSIHVLRIWRFSIVLVCLNSTINPIVYCWRMTEIREAMKETLMAVLSKLKCY
ncbi:melanocyte-stimulating hormone receptor-like [Exaiptasia diaphana]|uniref:G-protein coupled receptors family 1 profile domain-containing protein n=1 Tax=Exaiptasia diaphana TaxID=2652724 RepID=A0A913YGS2_EXADI|nr:melanocyte-stimulating hormone receptor-like [Exaiptasia diaphana]